ncbi:MAG: hypothetical protein AB7J28_07665 [Hyphomonadaceae bacterium]
MRGQVLGLDQPRGIGVLVDASGERLEFALAEWRSPGAPAPGQWVDFVLADGQAKQVFALPPGAPGTPAYGAGPGPAPAAPTPMGTILGAVALGCLVLGFVIPILPTIAALVLGIVGAGRAKEERDETGLTLSRIAWIAATVLLVLFVMIAIIAALFFGGLMGVLGTAGWNWGVWT